MDTQHDGLEKGTPFRHGNFLVSMLDFRRVLLVIFGSGLISYLAPLKVPPEIPIFTLPQILCLEKGPWLFAVYRG